eukprot:CAMPEP_0115001312 /NCGR_PEP_ID=MMETSP0216-20121206/17299_1 /TAXON_ID=223996 /ORGANISM="Protocruzia adherens, Strain Boccale" /LENGTH=731 /DNA_ID=CAMNT_0002366619 /DNA_START=155 /DNA_END=2349 /DNA_ORIENTATION=-
MSSVSDPAIILTFAYIASLKLKILIKENQCPVCKAELSDIVLSQDHQLTYEHLKQRDDLIVDEDDETLIYAGPEVAEKAYKIKNVACNVKDCTTQIKSIPQLEKHLKTVHNLLLCYCCLDKRAVFPVEQNYYRPKEMKNHKERGEKMEDGTIIHPHPSCSFCKRHYFDEDNLMAHLDGAHFKCEVCTDKYIYYRDFDELEKHLKESHFYCRNEDCKGLVFRTAMELQIHNLTNHLKHLSRSDRAHLHTQVLNGYLDNQVQMEVKKQSTGKKLYIGVDFTKEVNKRFREGRGKRLQEKYNHKPQPEKGLEHDKYVAKIESVHISEEEKAFTKKCEEEELYYEDLINYPFYKLADPVGFKEFEKKASKALKGDKEAQTQFKQFVLKYNQGKCSEDELFYHLAEVFPIRTLFDIFPTFICALKDRKKQYRLDLSFDKIVSTLPKRDEKHKNPLHVTKNNEKNALCSLYQLVSRELDDRKDVSSDEKSFVIHPYKEYQLAATITKLDIWQILKFDYCINFSISPETRTHLYNVVMGKEDIKALLANIDSGELIFIEKYLEFSAKKVRGKEFKVELSDLIDQYRKIFPDADEITIKRADSGVAEEESKKHTLGGSAKLSKYEYPTLMNENEGMNDVRNYLSGGGPKNFSSVVGSGKLGGRKSYFAEETKNEEFPTLPIYEKPKASNMKKSTPDWDSGATFSKSKKEFEVIGTTTSGTGKKKNKKPKQMIIANFSYK